jgi:hypothetical protein
MSFWQVTAHSTSATAVSQANTSGSASGGQQVRLRALTAYSSVTTLLWITDGATTIFNIDINPGTLLQLPNFDLRSTSNMTITTSAAGTTDINAQGDFVPIGYPPLGSGIV